MQMKHFLGQLLKRYITLTKNPFADVSHIARIFSKNYRPISPLDEQIVVLAQLIQYKRSMLAIEELNYNALASQKDYSTNNSACISLRTMS